MNPVIHWPAILVRLALTLLAGGLLGAERSKTGHAAGLRTVLLVTLAASVAMIQMNLLLETNGKPWNSYAVMDMMRLPLGILTGVGFIGAGAILRKNELVLGITTAATLWFATVVGLCLGGGQLLLGSLAAIIGFLVLWTFRWIERRFERYQLAELRVTAADGPLSPQSLRRQLEAAHFRVRSLSVTTSTADHRRVFACELLSPSEGRAEIPAIVPELEAIAGVVEVYWWIAGPGAG